MLFGAISTETLIWTWVVLALVGLAMKKAMNDIKNFYCGLGRAVYNSPIASAAAKQGASYFFRQLFR